MSKSNPVGRPPVFVGGLSKRIVQALERNAGNVTHAQSDLAGRKVKVSIPTIRKIGRAEGVTLAGRGRPSKVA